MIFYYNIKVHCRKYLGETSCFLNWSRRGEPCSIVGGGESRHWHRHPAAIAAPIHRRRGDHPPSPPSSPPSKCQEEKWFSEKEIQPRGTLLWQVPFSGLSHSGLWIPFLGHSSFWVIGIGNGWLTDGGGMGIGVVWLGSNWVMIQDDAENWESRKWVDGMG